VARHPTLLLSRRVRNLLDILSVVQRITLITVGAPRSVWVKEGVQEYVNRLTGRVDLRIVSVQPSKRRDPKQQREEESERLLSALEKQQGVVWVLDERGKECTSAQFAAGLSTLRDGGTPVTFVIGGAYGLSDALRRRADCLFALGQMTLPHELCSLVFLEQLYRAFEIARGSGYHHEG